LRDIRKSYGIGEDGLVRAADDVSLTITILGVPVAAALTGWILAGRQPPAIARRVLECP
jgi:hypothetical protein